MKRNIYIVVGCLLLSAVTSSAAELQLHAQAKPSGPLVLLGDVAEIHARHAVEAAALATIDLMPAPPAGEPRVLRLRELQDLLAVRGVNLAEHRFSGAASVRVETPGAELTHTVAQPRTVSTTSPVASKREIALRVQSAIEDHLQSSDSEQAYELDVKLTDSQSQDLAALGEPLRVTEDQAIDSDTHAFTLAGNAADRTPVEIRVAMQAAPMMVVAKHSLPKGVLINAEDVHLQRGRSTKGESEVFETIEEVVGKETTRIVAAGQILDDKSLRRPLMVRRGEMVTVYSRAAGVSVRMTARVRDDGAIGDLVSVETVEQRKPFYARVSGPQQVEVFAQGATATAEASPVANQESLEKAAYQPSRHIATPHGANAAQYRSRQ